MGRSIPKQSRVEFQVPIMVVERFPKPTMKVRFLHLERNFPRSQSESKAEVEGILADKYSKDIEEIQRGINILYQRYYDIEI